MFTFIKKLLGYPTEAEKAAAKAAAEAPYKVESKPQPVSVFVDGHGDVREVLVAAPEPVNPQITDAVTQPAPEPVVAKKKPASKKPAGEKKSAKKPGRKPKSTKA